MTNRTLERLLWGAAAGALVTAAARVQSTRRALSPRLLESDPTVTAPAVIAEVDGDSLDRSAGRAIEGNVFRRERTEIDVITTPITAPPQTPQPPPTPKPRLILRGLVGGPPWNAIIEGIPGRNQGVVLGVGDTASGFILQRASSGIVTISGLDTTWRLSVERRAVGVLP